VNRTRPGSVWLASSVALVVVLGAGFGYRAAADRFGRVAGTARLARGTLSQIPMTIGEFRGEDVPLDEAIVEITDTQDHLNRSYNRPGSDSPVALFIGYGIHMRDLMPHRPEVCYPGAGWTLETTERISLPIQEEPPLWCRVHYFSRGGLATQHATVLNYYIIDGKFEADVSAIRSRAWRFDARVKYMAQVQVSAGADAARTSAGESVRAFAAESAPVIRAFLEDAVADAEQRAEADAGD
jgi:EpsI family protein